MDSGGRKLLLIQENDPTLPVPQPGISSNTSSAETRLSSYRMNPPFDSSMALTVLLLLAALFFMGFFSFYIRRFSDEEHRRPYSGPYKRAAKGLDPKTLDSMPVYGYEGGGAKQGMVDCAICLSEFEKGEMVKAIPYCGHVFHVECIDTWLESHVTCPLCRTPKLFREEEVAVDGEAVAVEVETWS